MAIVFENELTQGLRGRVGKSLVFKKISGRTFATRRACKPDKTKATVAQRRTRTNFKMAIDWARRTVNDPVRKEYYKQRARELGLTNAYTAAITDYMRSGVSRSGAEVIKQAQAIPGALQIWPRYLNYSTTVDYNKVFLNLRSTEILDKNIIIQNSTFP